LKIKDPWKKSLLLTSHANTNDPLW